MSKSGGVLIDQLQCKSCGAALTEDGRCEYCGARYKITPLVKPDAIGAVPELKIVQVEDHRVIPIAAECRIDRYMIERSKDYESLSQHSIQRLAHELAEPLPIRWQKHR